MHVSSGQWYWEVTLGNDQYSIFGIIPSSYSMATSNNYWIAQVPGAYCFYPYTGNKYDNTTSSSYATADTAGTGDVYGMALDLDAGTMTYYKNGTSLGTAHTGISGSLHRVLGCITKVVGIFITSANVPSSIRRVELVDRLRHLSHSARRI